MLTSTAQLLLSLTIYTITAMSHPTTQDVNRLPLFGGSRPWTATEWTAQDDRVRGGVSVSYLIPSSEGTTAVFSGNLDSKTLNGTGFASQRTTENKVWDLTGYGGIEIVIVSENCDDRTNKTFTFVMKDEIPTNPNDQDQSTASHEASFRPNQGKKNHPEQVIFLPFKDFKTTYRGREQPDTLAANLSSIRRFSIMARSFFNKQSGPFQLTMVSVTAVTRPKGSLWRRNAGGFYDEYDDLDGDHDEDDMGHVQKAVGNGQPKEKGSWWGCLLQ